MKRRDFLKSMTARGGRPAPCPPPPCGPAKAQSRQETLLFVTEAAPTTSTSTASAPTGPGYEVSWNCYDRLMTLRHEDAAGRHASPTTRDKFDARAGRRAGRRADGMSVTFKLRKDAKFHDGTPVTAKDVKWSFDRAVTVGGFPTFQMKAGSLEKPEQFVVVDDHTFRVDFIRKDKLTMPDLAVHVPVDLSTPSWSRSTPPRRTPGASTGTKTNIAGGGAYKVASWRPAPEIVYDAQRRLEERPAAEDQARHLARGAVGRQPPRAARARRRRHLLRPAAQGLRRARGRPARSRSPRRRSRTASGTWA